MIVVKKADILLNIEYSIAKERLTHFGSNYNNFSRKPFGFSLRVFQKHITIFLCVIKVTLSLISVFLKIHLVSGNV